MGKDTLYFDTKHLDRLTLELKGFEKEVGEAARLAIDRTLDHIVTKVGQTVPKYYAVKSTEVKESFKGGIKKPTKTNLTASVTSVSRRLSFAHFPYTPKTPKRGRKGTKSVFQYAVMVTIKKDKGKVLSRTGFVATTGAKSEDKTQFNVFHRLGKNRFPIAPIRTLSIPQMITNEGIGKIVMESAEQKMKERLEHEIMRQMTTVAKKISG